jgi:hypothetical protein
MCVEFNKNIEVRVDIYDTTLAQIFYDQHVHYQNNVESYGTPSLMDHSRFTIKYFEELIEKARDIPGFSWQQYDIKPGMENYINNQRQFNSMHRDLEVWAGINKYAGLSVPQQTLLNELHCCLHTLETPNVKHRYEFRGRDFLQIRHDIEKTLTRMPDKTKFERVVFQGQIVLEYPYVGKEPMACLLHNDNSELEQSCRVIDHVSLGWKMNVSRGEQTHWLPRTFPENIDQALTEWYYTNQKSLDNLGYDLDLILSRSGWAVVGQIRDVRQLGYLRKTQYLEITGYDLIG